MASFYSVCFSQAVLMMAPCSDLQGTPIGALWGSLCEQCFICRDAEKSDSLMRSWASEVYGKICVFGFNEKTTFTLLRGSDPLCHKGSL